MVVKLLYFVYVGRGVMKIFMLHAPCAANLQNTAPLLRGEM
jgi:hypothetical protein